MILEPKWKSWIVQTTTPIFTPDQCKQIIEAGRRQPPQQAQEATMGGSWRQRRRRQQCRLEKTAAAAPPAPPVAIAQAGIAIHGPE